MDDHTVIVVLEYHAMAEDCGAAIARVLGNLHKPRADRDLDPIHVRTSCDEQFTRLPPGTIAPAAGD